MSSSRTQVRARGGRSRPTHSRAPYAEPSTSSATRLRARQGQRQRHRSPSASSWPDTEVAPPTSIQSTGFISTLRLTGGDDEWVEIPPDLESVMPDPLPGLDPVPNSPHPVETIAIPNSPGVVIEITENLGDMGSSRLVFRDSAGVIIPPPSYIEVYNPYLPDHPCLPEGEDGEWYYMLNQDCGFHIRDSRVGGDILALAPIIDLLPVE
ncbi:hypothetical protein PENSPDRAFT_749240, partial [Peniophora sp. CONT]